MKLAVFRDTQAPLSELKRTLARFNDTGTDYPRDRSVTSLFAEQVAAQPQAVAVIHDGRSSTYRELDEAANRLARLLVAHGLEPEDRVGVMVDEDDEDATADDDDVDDDVDEADEEALSLSAMTAAAGAAAASAAVAVSMRPRLDRFVAAPRDAGALV